MNNVPIYWYHCYEQVDSSLQRGGKKERMKKTCFTHKIMVVPAEKSIFYPFFLELFPFVSSREFLTRSCLNGTPEKHLELTLQYGRARNFQ
jgi:hypothetical protein